MVFWATSKLCHIRAKTCRGSAKTRRGGAGTCRGRAQIQRLGYQGQAPLHRICAPPLLVPASHLPVNALPLHVFARRWRQIISKFKLLKSFECRWSYSPNESLSWKNKNHVTVPVSSWFVCHRLGTYSTLSVTCGLSHLSRFQGLKYIPPFFWPQVTNHGV